MKGKMYESTGTDVELVEAMLDNLDELLLQMETSIMNEDKKLDAINKLKFTKKYISSFATQL